MLTNLLVESLAGTVDEHRLFAQLQIDSLSDGELRMRLCGAEVAAWHLEPRGRHPARGGPGAPT